MKDQGIFHKLSVENDRRMPSDWLNNRLAAASEETISPTAQSVPSSETLSFEALLRFPDTRSDRWMFDANSHPSNTCHSLHSDCYLIIRKTCY